MFPTKFSIRIPNRRINHGSNVCALIANLLQKVDCANCANLVEKEARKVEGVKDLSIAFMTQKMKVTFEDGANQDAVMAEVLKVAKKVEPDFEIL